MTTDLTKQDVSDFIDKALSKESAWAQKDVFTDEEQVATRYFYQRLRAIYGGAKFKSTFPTDLDLQLSRREFARLIGQHSRDQIDYALDHARLQIREGDPDFLWPNVALILSGLTLAKIPAHKQLTSPKPMTLEEREKSRSIGIKAMARLKAAFNE